ncbi:MAG: hypothetical protein RSC92_03015 [Clostridia bacterium]
MKISKKKFIAIFVIITILLYEIIIIKNSNINKNTYLQRRITYEDNELPLYENEYVMQKYAFKYLNNFLNELQIDPKNALIKYVEENCYNDIIKNNEEEFITKLKQKIIIEDTENNNYGIVEKEIYKNDDNKKIMPSDVVVLKKGLEYPAGYNVLININNKDKDKIMDINVLEVSPYTFKIFFNNIVDKKGDE